MKAKPKATEAPAKVSKAELSELCRMTDAEFTSWQDELSLSKNRPVGVSGFRGVFRHSNSNKWQVQARTRHGRVQVYIGIFESKLEAARAYDRFNLAHRGRDALLNFHPRNYVSPEGDLLPAEKECPGVASPSTSATDC